MDPFACYYCVRKFDKFETVIDHSIALHGDSILKVKSSELNIKTGTMGYRTHNFTIVPNVEQKRNKTIKISCNEQGSLSIRVESNASKDDMCLFLSPLSKKSKYGDRQTPTFSLEEEMECGPFDKDTTEGEKCHNDEAMNTEWGHDDDDSDDEDDKIMIKEMTKRFPAVLATLKENGHMQTWKSFIDMMYNKTFPMKNVAFLLFMDVVKWYSSDTTVSMRYDQDVIKFWRIGYRLFHGRFLRFMSGPKNRGSLIMGATEKGIYDPHQSKINFAVPYRRITQTLDASRASISLSLAIAL